MNRSSIPLDKVDLASSPLFVATMLAEHRTLERRLERLDTGEHDDRLVPLGYERRDTTASLWMLVGNITVSLLTLSAVSRLHRALFGRRIANLGARRGSFLTAMVMWDFLYYWTHRIDHEKRIFWADHVSHHSSQRYNLSTALRQPWSGYLTAWMYLPMPLLGIDFAQFARARQLNLLYQYWIHTEAIDRLPARAEAVLNTPSHHRVHHGANPQYLDKNYGGILIIWDKLFGSFEPEVEPVTYGLTKNISSYNPFVIAYHEMADMARDVLSARGWRTKLSHVWKRPGWQPKGTPCIPEPTP